jgi:hypothetical protein
MVDQDPDRQPFLRRPVRSVLDVSIGTALKAYALWVVGGVVMTLVVALLLFGAFGVGGTSSSDDGSAVIAPGRHAVTLAEYRSVTPGSRKSEVQGRFGRPATTNDPLQSQAPQALREDCIGYERAGGQGSVAFFCFTDGRLTSKHTL